MVYVDVVDGKHNYIYHLPFRIKYLIRTFQINAYLIKFHSSVKPRQEKNGKEGKYEK